MPIKKETPKDNNSFKNIKVQNIFYMLAYVHREAMPSDYAQMDVEKFHKVNDLFAGILEVGISRQIKQGLHKEYINRSEAMPTLRGKLDIQGSFRLQLQKKKLLACNFDELSENNIYNQILKSTAQMMIRDSTVDDERKSALKKVLLFFQNVDEINLFDVPWNRLQYQRNNRNYNFLMNICNYAVLQYLPIIAKKEKLETNKSIADNTWQRKRIGGLQSTKTKAVNFNGFFSPDYEDGLLYALYEEFVCAYFKYHYGDQITAGPESMCWQITDPSNLGLIKKVFPKMRTDITLKHENKKRILIIDTKCYDRILSEQTREESPRDILSSKNLYQIFAYVKNKSIMCGTWQINGMLLYARTDSLDQDGKLEFPQNISFCVDGHKFWVKTLNLNCKFSEIENQLNEIIKTTFDNVEPKRTFIRA